jgi:hypothetical protein
VNHRSLDHALKARGRLGVIAAVRDKIFELGFQIVDETGAELVEIDAAGAHDRGRVRVIDQRQQQVFKRRILMVTLVCYRQRAMQGLFKALRKSRHSRPLWAPAIMIAEALSGNNNLYPI